MRTPQHQQNDHQQERQEQDESKGHLAKAAALQRFIAAIEPLTRA